MPLLIKTELKNSQIHGLGVFTLEKISLGQTVWEHDAILDGFLHKNLILKTKYTIAKIHIEYLYPYDADIDCYIKACDNINFLNHSSDPNLSAPTKYIHIAARDIEIGEELTVNYADICDLAKDSLEF